LTNNKNLKYDKKKRFPCSYGQTIITMTKKKKSSLSLSKIGNNAKKSLHKIIKDFQKAPFKQKVYIFLIFTAFLLVGVGLYASSIQRTTDTDAQTPPVRCSVEATLCDVDGIESCINNPAISCDTDTYDVNGDTLVNQEDVYLCQVCTSSVTPACSALCYTNFDCTQSCGDTYQCIIPAHDCGPEQVCPTQGPGKCHPIMNAPALTPTPTPQDPPADVSPTPPGVCDIACFGNDDCTEACGTNFRCTQNCPDDPNIACTQVMGECVPINAPTPESTPTPTPAEPMVCEDIDCQVDTDCTGACGSNYRCMIAAVDCLPGQVCPTQGPGSCEPINALTPTPAEPMVCEDIDCQVDTDCTGVCGSNYRCMIAAVDCLPGQVCPTQGPGSCEPINALTPTSVPLCQTKPEGDADCDGDIDLTDFNEWRVEYRALVTEDPASHTNDADGLADKWDANFDGQNNASTDYPVDLTDFNIWRSTYIDILTEEVAL
jgi:hypothetical protein